LAVCCLGALTITNQRTELLVGSYHVGPAIPGKPTHHAQGFGVSKSQQLITSSLLPHLQACAAVGLPRHRMTVFLHANFATINTRLQATKLLLWATTPTSTTPCAAPTT
jgi:hypothetical protein